MFNSVRKHPVSGSTEPVHQCCESRLEQFDADPDPDIDPTLSKVEVNIQKLTNIHWNTSNDTP